MTRRLVAIAMLVSVVAWCAAPRAAAEELGRKYPNGLPKYLTEEEKLIPIDGPTVQDFRDRVPPEGTVYCPAEYEFNRGIFMSWEGYTDLLTQMTVGITTQTEAFVYMVVDTSSELTTVRTTLTNAGANMDQVTFFVRTTDTVWIRDYGPRGIYEDGEYAIIDHTYNRPRPNDNLLNDHVATVWACPQYDIPLTHGGGNFHLFSNGDAFMTTLILAENPGLTEQDVIDLYADYQNLNLTIYEGFPTSFDSTRHIDMWMLPTDDYEVIIGEYSPSSGSPYTITENAVADLLSRGYTVRRTPGWNSGGTHYTYTNAVILNDVVFVPQFSGYTSQNAEAMAVFAEAFPDRTIITVDCSSIIHAAGAVHCIVMHVPGALPSMAVTPASDFESAGNAGGPFTPPSMTYTLENMLDIPLNYEITWEADWLSVDLPSGFIPEASTLDVALSLNENAEDLPNGVYEERVYFTNTSDDSGSTVRDVVLRIGVPEIVYNFSMDTDPGWTTQGLWAFGDPTGQGGDHGDADPDAGYDGPNVYGYNLSGDYEANLPERNLTTTAIDCSELTQTSLKFKRWLGVEQPSYDHAYLRVSNDGSTWTTLWENGGEVNDGAWVDQEYDISGYADGEETFYVRWTMGTTDYTWQYCGWNIDNVEIWGVAPSQPACPWDFDDNGFVGPVDAGMVKNHLGCDVSDPECAAYDLDGNGFVGPVDVGEVKNNFGPCP